MAEDERRAFLSAGTRTAEPASVRADGRAHVAPVWFVLDGDDVLFNTGKTSVKGRDLARDPSATICVDDDRPPYAFVLVEGKATISEEPAELPHWAARIGGRYMGEDRAEEFGARNGVPGELLVRLRPTRIVAAGGIAE
jgi:PPOX class probable F420-dependent enzyme